MATYAVLGGTGGVGGSIVTVLLQDPKRHIRVYVRSKRKLSNLRPELESLPNVSIYEGGLDDVEQFTKCVTGTQVVFLSAGASDNIPGCDVARQQARTTVEALTQLRKQDMLVKLPRVVVLSAAPVVDEWMKDMPRIEAAMLRTGLSNVYSDLAKAEAFLRAYDWIDQVYVKPGGLLHDQPRGHELTTSRVDGFLSFLDCAAGMVEVADAEDGKWNMQNVCVAPATPGTRFNYMAPYVLLKGALWHFFPWLYPSLSKILP